jgi:hypothetical protein
LLLAVIKTVLRRQKNRRIIGEGENKERKIERERERERRK